MSFISSVERFRRNQLPLPVQRYKKFKEERIMKNEKLAIDTQLLLSTKKVTALNDFSTIPSSSTDNAIHELHVIDTLADETIVAIISEKQQFTDRIILSSANLKQVPLIILEKDSDIYCATLKSKMNLVQHVRHTMLNQLPLFKNDRIRLLNLKHNSIMRLPQLHFLYPSIVLLDLFDNRLTAINGINQLISLKVLLLGKNRIKKIENMRDITSLDILDLHSNQITIVENLEHLSNLRILNLADNRIKSLSILDNGFGNLSELNVKKNCIRQLPTSLKNLRKLKRIFLSRNRFSSLRSIGSLRDCIELQELSIERTPLMNIDDHQDSSVQYTKQQIIEQFSRIQILNGEKINSFPSHQLIKNDLMNTNGLKVSTINIDTTSTNFIKKNQQQFQKFQTNLFPIKRYHHEKSFCNSSSLSNSMKIHVPPNQSHSVNDYYRTTRIDSRRATSRSSSRRSNVQERVIQSAHSNVRPSSLKQKTPTNANGNDVGGKQCLFLFGHHALETFLKNSVPITIASISTKIVFNSISINQLSNCLIQIQSKYPNLQSFEFNDCSIQRLDQLTTMELLNNPVKITLKKKNNFLNNKIWRLYLLQSMSCLEELNNKNIESDHRQESIDFVGPFYYLINLLSNQQLLNLSMRMRNKKKYDELKEFISKRHQKPTTLYKLSIDLQNSIEWKSNAKESGLKHNFDLKLNDWNERIIQNLNEKVIKFRTLRRQHQLNTRSRRHRISFNKNRSMLHNILELEKKCFI
ncbi:hypothetical protein SNEBB_000263 [Seison nebaliae]|nr:hypothetical protein SNEBB_000263 [Seison nebaliae]